MTVKQLESSAVAAHARGERWGDFWSQHGAEVCRAEPHDRRRFARLVRRLCILVAAGDLDGAEPVPATWGQPEPWEIDDQAVVPVVAPSDTTTAARCLWTPGRELSQ